MNQKSDTILSSEDMKRGLLDYGIGADFEIILALSELAMAAHKGRDNPLVIHSPQEEMHLNRVEQLLKDRMDAEDSARIPKTTFVIDFADIERRMNDTMRGKVP